VEAGGGRRGGRDEGVGVVVEGGGEGNAWIVGRGGLVVGGLVVRGLGGWLMMEGRGGRGERGGKYHLLRWAFGGTCLGGTWWRFEVWRGRALLTIWEEEMELHRGECMAVPCSDALYEL